MASASISGGERFAAKMEDLTDKMADPPTLYVGFLENATPYPNGIPVAAIAMINEYGATINRDAGEVDVFRKTNAAGTGFLKKGRFVKRSEANFVSTHTHDAYAITIPPRPFFRTMIQAHKAEWGPEAAQLLRENNMDVMIVANRMGELISGELKDSIKAFSDPQNAPSTIAKKGFNDPLIETGHMWNSVDYSVEYTQE